MKMNKKYNILECFTQCKSTNENRNEDGIYIGDHFIAVIDGATSKTSITLDGKTSGQIARDIIIEKLSSFKGNEDSGTVVKELQREIVNFSQNHKIDHLSASAVIYSCMRREIWSIGDCQFSVNGYVEQNVKRIDQVFSEARSIALYALLEAGYNEKELFEHDLAREYLLPFLKLQKFLENKSVKYGYCVFNGDCPSESFPLEMIRITAVPEEAEVILASDGYPQLGNTLAESENNLNKILTEDPFCYKINCSTKGLVRGNVSFDDRTYIRFHVL